MICMDTMHGIPSQQYIEQVLQVVMHWPLAASWSRQLCPVKHGSLQLEICGRQLQLLTKGASHTLAAVAQNLIFSFDVAVSWVSYPSLSCCTKDSSGLSP